ncbi:UNVERIFIED_CONTAM: hypothetical protein PYX00_007250 [Menopon gallinae]|uniref:Uncharacterized protein n=1 Tax=Menopon gallinae TaxID=328185 RepID=A0AAW2HJ54_9NEOP
MLLLVTPYVCKTWAKLSMDWTLWKNVEYLQIKSMVVTTNEVKTLLRTIPKLKKLELVLRNDAEELLEELFHTSDHLEMLRLDRCSRSEEHTNIPPKTIQSILESCPKLKSVILADTYFHSREFYRCLAERFRTFERINISCTTKSEMDFFVDRLKSHVSSVEFQNVSMMGKAEGKQIYWGPILGLVIRPNPTSPYHRQHANSQFPSYAF